MVTNARPQGSSPAEQANGPERRGWRRQRIRDRHGRGLREPLIPAALPGARTRAELFDEAVLEAVAELDDQWPGQLASIEFAVDEVPPLPVGPVMSSSDVVVDGGTPLARFLPPGVDARGRATKARVIVYRRPIEMRAPLATEVSDLVSEVLYEQLSAVLGDGAG